MYREEAISYELVYVFVFYAKYHSMYREEAISYIFVVEFVYVFVFGAK